MDDQKDLFDKYNEPLVTPPRARADDDQTSHLAASRHYQSGKARRHSTTVLNCVQEHPDQTAAELGAITQLGHHEAQRRLSDLLRDGVVKKGPARKCNKNNNLMVTWHCTERE